MEVKESTILVVAAHPDDEVLGCGGSVHKWSQMGAKVHALIMAEGLTARAEKREDISCQALGSLREDAKHAAKLIGYQSISFETFPDNRMDSVDLLDVVHALSRYVDQFHPDVVLTHHHSDLNIDHRICFQAVLTACRPLPEHFVRTILSFETPSATEWNFPYYKNCFSPNIFVDISEHIKAKTDAMSCYKTELRAAPHPRSIRSLDSIAQHWGSVTGCDYAEAFELVRTIL